MTQMQRAAIWQSLLRLFAAVGLVVGVAHVAVLRATVVVPSEFQEIVSDAALIVRGRVTDVRAVTAPDRSVESVATVAVDAVLKGEAGAFVYVRVPGGEQGRTRVVMIGAPALKVDTSAVFFLSRGASDNAWRPVGLTSGVMPVVRSPLTGQAVVHAPVLRSRAASEAVVRGDARRRDLAVGDFEALVRLVVVDRRAVPRPRP